MPSSVADIQEAIRAAGGALRFDRFMELALYGAHGFYSQDGHAGRRGDFLTSPEVGPLFGAVLARWIESEFERLGRPDEFVIVEYGAGPGTLARSILLAAPRWRDRYVAIEVSERQRSTHPSEVRSVATHDGSVVGVVIANELLDNLPFRLAVFDGGWREASVALDRTGTFLEQLWPAPAEWAWLPASAPHGARVPIQDRACGWVGQVLARLAAGRVLAIDYCVPTTSALLVRPWRDWLRTYAGHQAGEHYLRHVGRQDITADVCVDQLPTPISEGPQSGFLEQWGIRELVADGARRWAENAAAPTIDALRGRSRTREAEALLDPRGLGAFTALEWEVAG